MTRRITATAVAVLSLGAVLYGASAWVDRAETGDSEPSRGTAPSSLRATFEALDAPAPGRVTILAENSTSWAERWRLVNSAERSIVFSSFILADDTVGWSFLGALQDRARAGVEVRMIVDGVGTDVSGAFRGALEQLAAEGVRSKIVRPIVSRVTDAILSLDPADVAGSEHDKILVVDGTHSIVGGRNVALEYVAGGGDLPTAFMDLDVLVESEGVAQKLDAAFAAQWNSDDSSPIEPAADARLEARLERARQEMDGWLRGDSDSSPTFDFAKLDSIGGVYERRRSLPSYEVEAIVLDSRVRDDDEPDPLSRGLARLVDAAKNAVWIESPYLVVSDEVVEVLAAASRRGVTFDVLTNSPVSSDNRLSQVLFTEQWPHILERVPSMRIFVEGTRRTLHAKMGVLDETLALVGTYNLDPLSMATNSEVVIGMWSPELAAALERRGRALVARGDPEVFEYRIRRTGGKVEVAFGPEDHCPADVLESLALLRTVHRGAETVLEAAEVTADVVQTTAEVAVDTAEASVEAAGGVVAR